MGFRNRYRLWMWGAVRFSSNSARVRPYKVNGFGTKSELEVRVQGDAPYIYVVTGQEGDFQLDGIGARLLATSLLDAADLVDRLHPSEGHGKS